jgi:predicted RNase H-like HicB family nuclease
MSKTLVIVVERGEDGEFMAESHEPIVYGQGKTLAIALIDLAVSLGELVEIFESGAKLRLNAYDRASWRRWKWLRGGKK